MRVRTPIYLQQETAECGAVALRIVLAYYGRHASADELRQACGVSRDGVRGDQLVQAARTYGLDARAFRKPITGLTAMSFPLIAFMVSHHFVVIEGIDPQTVWLNDPAFGRRKQPLEEFVKQYSGIVFTFTPMESFQKGGSRSEGGVYWARHVARFRWSLIFLVLTALPLTFGGLLYAALVRVLFDDVGLRRNGELILPVIAVTVLLAVVVMGFALVHRYQQVHLEHAQNIQSSPSLLWRLLHLPDSFFTRRSTGEIATRFELIEAVSAFLTRDFSQLWVTVVGSALYMMVLALYHPMISLVSGGLLVLYGVVTRLFDRRLREAAYQAQMALGRLSGSAVYSLQQIEQVKASGTEQDVFQRLVGLYVDSQDAAQNILRANRWLRALLTGIIAINTLLTVLIGVEFVRSGLWSIGMFVAVQTLVTTVWGLATTLSGLGGRAAFVRGGINRLEDIPTGETSGTPPDPLADGTVQLERVVFGYKSLDAPLISELTATVPAGQSVGIVGASGSGKSTLARLIAGIYRPQQGTIRSGRTALVDQELFLFDGTIWENLTFWDSALPPEQVIRAAIDAEIHTDILALLDGYETLLSAQARNLSGGQRQRLHIARALAVNPQVLILDEATSALDPVLEQRIFDNIRRRDCTLMVVSHRISAVQACDDIWVMDAGQLVERGTMGSLRERGGVFAQLISMGALADMPPILTPTPAAEPPFVPPQMPERSVPTALQQLASVESWRSDPLHAEPSESSILRPRETTSPDWLRALLRESHKDWYGFIASAVFLTVLQIIPSVLIAFLINSAIPESNAGLVVQVAAALMVCALTSILLNFAQETAAIRLQVRFDFRVQSALWQRLLSLPPAFFRRFSAGDLVTRMIQARAFSEGTAQSIMGGFYAVFAIVGGMVGIGLVYGDFSAWVMGLIVGYLVLLTVIGLRFLRGVRLAAQRTGENSGWLATLLSGANHLQAANAVHRAFAVWAERFGLLRYAHLRGRRAETLLSVVHTVLPFAALLMLTASMMFSPPTNLGTLIATHTILLFITANLTLLGNVTLSVLKLVPAAERIAPVVKQRPESRLDQRRVRMLTGDILLRDVTFRYSVQPALQNLSLHIRAGEYIAIVGASGSGKSTLLRLLLGFETPESGSITYDGQPIQSLEPSSLRAQIGTVMQHSDLIQNGSLFKNIAGMRHITLDEAWEALRFAGLEAFVAGLPMGIHTLLSEGGRTLSAGQRQRLLIARAIVHKPRLLFFDEATSAVDDATQAILMHGLRSFTGTRLVIAHRLSTVRHADRIILLDKGRVAEEGTYADLIAQDGLFAEFVRAQLLIST